LQASRARYVPVYLSLAVWNDCNDLSTGWGDETPWHRWLIKNPARQSVSTHVCPLEPARSGICRSSQRLGHQRALSGNVVLMICRLAADFCQRRYRSLDRSELHGQSWRASVEVGRRTEVRPGHPGANQLRGAPNTRLASTPPPTRQCLAHVHVTSYSANRVDPAQKM